MRRIFGLGQRELVGVDIGAAAVRIVQLHKTDAGYGITGAAASPIAPGEDDPVRHRMHTIAAIRQCLSGGGMDGRLAVCGLRGPEVAVRSFEFSGLPLEEIGGAVSLDASQICPFSMQDSALDCQVTSCEDGKARGFWVAATKFLIENTQRLVHEAGLRCVLLDIDGLALLNCLAVIQRQSLGAGRPEVAPRTTSNGGVAAVLDVGDSCTTIAIADHAGRPFVRDIASGSEQILNQLALDTRVGNGEVPTPLPNPWDNELSCSASGPAQKPTRDAGTTMLAEDLPLESLGRACAELVDEIVTTLRYYAAQNGSARVSRMLVCGSLAPVYGFVELLGTKLHIEVEPWNPPAELCQESTGPWEPLLREAGSSLAVATGLALRSI